MNQKIKTNNIFSTCNGILMYGKQVVIPAVLTRKILKDFHTGHPGTRRMKALMWSYVYWLDIDKDIENMVKSCKNCASVGKAPPIKFNQWRFDKRNILFCQSRQLYEISNAKRPRLKPQ